MDKKTSKETNKMRRTAAQIVKKRRQRDSSLQESKKFREIEKLLEEPFRGESSQQAAKPVAPIDSKIPNSAPGINFLSPDRMDWIFTEEGFKTLRYIPRDFITPNIREATMAPLKVYSLISSLLFQLGEFVELRKVTKFVMYIMASTTDERLVNCCWEYLQTHPTPISNDHLIVVLSNFGAPEDTINFSIPTDLVMDPRRTQIPLRSLELVISYLIVCVKAHGLEYNELSFSAINFLTKLALDTTIRGTPVLGPVIQLLSLMIDKCSAHLKLKDIVNSIVKIDHPMNNLEVCRFLRTNQPFTDMLIRRTIYKMLRMKSVALRNTNRMKGVIRICRSKVTTSPLKVYVVLQLIIAMMPYMEITEQVSSEWTRETTALESCITAEVRDASDAMRLHGVCAQLRGLLLMSVGLKQIE